MLRKGHYLPVNAKFVLVKYSLINSWNWIHVMSDVTLDVNVASNNWRSTANQVSANWNRLDSYKKRMFSFCRDSGNGKCCLISYEWLSLLALLRLCGSDRRHSEWTDSNIKSINNLNCRQEGQWATRSLILIVDMFSVNFVTFVFCKLIFCHGSLENVTGNWCFLSSFLTIYQTKTIRS